MAVNTTFNTNGYTLSNALKKVNKGICQSEPADLSSNDILHGRYINLIMYYKWESSAANGVIDKCTVTIGWQPSKYNDSYNLESEVFKQNGIKITVNGVVSNMDSLNLETGLINDKPKVRSIITDATDNIPIVLSYIYTTTVNNQSTEYRVNIKSTIPRPSRYDDNVVFNKEGLNEFIQNIKDYPIIDLQTVEETDKDTNNRNIWETYTGGSPCVKVVYGDQTKAFESGAPRTVGFKYVKVGSNIIFKDANGNDITTQATGDQPTGTFRVSINNKIYQIPIKGLSGGSGAINLGGSLIPDVDSQVSSSEHGYNLGASTKQWNVLYARGAVFGNADETGSDTGNDAASDVKPYANNTGNLGTSTARWNNIYGNVGNFTTLTVNGNTVQSTMLPTTTSDTSHFWRGNGEWSNTLTGTLILTRTTDASPEQNNDVALVIGNRDAQHLEFDSNEILAKASGTTLGTLSLNNGCTINSSGYLTAERVYNAVFNDYAEFRTTINLSPGHAVIDNDDGSLSCTSKRLQPGAQIISDTFGHSMGETDTAKTPLAVAGRVLVYTYQPRENYHAGMAVCSAPDGTVDIMTREEIKDYPDCIIGIVSEIPQYEYWGTDNVKVDDRIWIKVK